MWAWRRGARLIDDGVEDHSVRTYPTVNWPFKEVWSGPPGEEVIELGMGG